MPFNKVTYDGMSAAQRAVVDRALHTRPGRRRIASPWADFEHAGRDLTLKRAAGHTVVELTPEQLGKWKDALAPGDGGVGGRSSVQGRATTRRRSWPT